MSRKFQFLTIVLAALILWSLAMHSSARADGLLFSNGVFRQPLDSHVSVVIKDKVATTTLEQSFQNSLDKELSALYIAPVPPGATVNSFAEQIDGVWHEATTEEKNAAAAGFNSAASKGDDAAVTDGVVGDAPANVDSKTTFETRVVLPPNGTRTVRLTYTEVLLGEGGLTRYSYPLSNTNWTDEPVGDLLIKVNIIEQGEIRAVYSPSNGSDVDISRPDSSDAEVTYHQQNIVPKQNFDLVYTQSTDKFGLNVVSYRATNDQDGYFLLVASPQLQAQQEDIIQKDFVFVLDVSGSMSGQKADQAKAALNKMLDDLHSGDRFTVIIFSSDVTPYSTTLLSLDGDEREKAKAWVNNFAIDGATDISEALQTALNTVDMNSNRPHIIVFLTDGQPTRGVLDAGEIVNTVKSQIHAQTRLFTVGVGADVNQPLLEALAQANRGISMMITDMDKLETQLQTFYAAINNPVLVDLVLDFGGIQTYDVQPDPIPDMFLGGQVVLTGRYKTGGLATVTLTGNINGKAYNATYPNIKFITDTADAKSYSYVPQLWAQRKVDDLVRKIALDGPTAQAVNEVKTLGLQYKIVTPYTSFLVTSKSPTAQPSNPTMQQISASQPHIQQSGIPQTGLPFLYVDDYRTINTALILAGGLLVLIGLVGWLWMQHHAKA